MKSASQPILVCCFVFKSFTIYANEEIQQPNTKKEDIEIIEVVASRPSGITISSTKMATMPGSLGDPLKALNALPGVILAAPSSGGPVAQPAIRGSSPRDNQYLSDFLPVGYVFHQDSLSIFNSELIESFELRTSGWSGQYNDAIGGVIATQLRDPSFEKASLFLDLSMIRSGILFETPLTENTAFYLSYRESLIHNFVDEIVEDEDFTFSQPPRNHDYQAKFVWDIDFDNIFKLVATGAEDKVRQAYKDDASEVSRNPDLASGEGFEGEYNNVGFIWLNNSRLGEATTAINFLTSSLAINEGIAEQSESNINEILIKSTVISSISDAEIIWGGELKKQKIEQKNVSRLQPCNSDFDTCLPTSFAPIVEDFTKIDVMHSSLFFHWQHNINSDWQTEIGALVNTNDFTNENLFEPRLSARYNISKTSNINFSLGKHHQWFRNYNYLSPVFGNPDLVQSKANMAGISFEQQLYNGWQWKFDLYYKQLFDLIIANPDAQKSPSNENNNPPTQFVNDGEGTAWGAELLINKALTDNWYGWFSLAYANSERKNKKTNVSFNYEFDIPIIVNLVSQYQFNSQWHIGLKWHFQSGRRYSDILYSTPIYNEDESIDTPAFYQPIYGDFNSGQRDASHRLDIRLDYFTDIAQYPINVHLDILNIYGHQKIQEDEWNTDYTESIADYEFPDEPFFALGMSIRF